MPLTDRLKKLDERKRYEPAGAEARVWRRWEEAGAFHPDPEGEASESFSIAVPPPNVTGELHMGHALNASIQDVCVRVARMRGRRAKWIYGTDHAGIATQVKVEEQLRAEGTSREELGRERFVERVWEWREQYGSRITEQFQRLGASLDYADERFTMDDRYARAVAHVFVKLYEKGLVFRDNYMVNWDPGSGSAISDLEVEQRWVEDTLYSIDYPLESGAGAVTVATVRPETMLADTAIAVNPTDERYTRLVGEAAILPIVGRRLPIIADPYVDPGFGTGALKITPGHDPNDFEIGRRHRLEEITAIGEDGRMAPAAGERFAGMGVEDARREVVGALREEDRISGTRPWEHEVPHSHRSGRRIEPLISLQWFCDVTRLAGPAIDVVRDGTLRFHPEKPWTGVYLDWLEKIRPWCISRQLWWGHQLPVWYRGDEQYVGTEAPEGEGWARDPDVLDTWFSSALWPFATLGWPEETPELRTFYPTDVLSTARDIIFLWVARMVMFGIEFTKSVPFTDVPIHSVIQAPDGRRMSKSLGTGVDPIQEIDEHGADALRFGLLAMSSTQDVSFSAQRVQQGRDLANKLWNASRLVLLGVPPEARPDPDAAETVEDRWIVSRLERLTESTGTLVDCFEFSRATLELYGGFWSELCDWYLELAKPRLYSPDNSAVSAVLLHALERMLVLLHPAMPFVTEEVWSFLPGERGLLALASWPEADHARIDDEAETRVARLIEAVTELRRYRDDVGAKASVAIPVHVEAEGYEELDDQMARLARLTLASNGDDPVAEVRVPGGTVRILPSEAFDPEEARRRFAARREKLEAEIGRLEAKLADQRFTGRAPAEVVEGERAKLAECRAALEAARA
ncbi:MAG: valine--tRNA ligase [Actinomycetota bacterium]|nr:valine--tRNA ligase [Actinomycetota bacterium]